MVARGKGLCLMRNGATAVLKNSYQRMPYLTLRLFIWNNSTPTGNFRLGIFTKNLSRKFRSG